MAKQVPPQKHRRCVPKGSAGASPHRRNVHQACPSQQAHPHKTPQPQGAPRGRGRATRNADTRTAGASPHRRNVHQACRLTTSPPAQDTTTARCAARTRSRYPLMPNPHRRRAPQKHQQVRPKVAQVRPRTAGTSTRPDPSQQAHPHKTPQPQGAPRGRGRATR